MKILCTQRAQADADCFIPLAQSAVGAGGKGERLWFLVCSVRLSHLLLRVLVIGITCHLIGHESYGIEALKAISNVFPPRAHFGEPFELHNLIVIPNPLTVTPSLSASRSPQPHGSLDHPDSFEDPLSGSSCLRGHHQDYPIRIDRSEPFIPLALFRSHCCAWQHTSLASLAFRSCPPRQRLPIGRVVCCPVRSTGTQPQAFGFVCARRDPPWL